MKRHAGGPRPHRQDISVLDVDAHHHFWNPGREPQPWMTDEHAAINRAFEPSDLEPLLAACGVQRTVLVQAAATDLDTIAMFEHAARHDWIGGVVAWVPLDAPAHAGEPTRPARRGAEAPGHPSSHPPGGRSPLDPPTRGARGHRAPSSSAVSCSSFPASSPTIWATCPRWRSAFPGSPSSSTTWASRRSGHRSWTSWAAQLWAAAASANVAAKVSGLNTVLPPGFWDARICSLRSRSRTSASDLTGCSAAATGRWRS